MKCLEPIKIGPHTVRNRFSCAPMNVRLHTHDGYVTERTVAHYRRIARGGAGLVNLELHIVRQDGLAPYFNTPYIQDDSCIPGMRKIADAIHAEGAVCQVQLGHFGKFAAAEIPLAASASVPSLLPPGSGPYGNASTPLHEATTDEVEEVLDDYVRSALRVKAAGFDGVLAHIAHGFLPQQFMSPHSNRRTDRWGQDRMLFPTELVRRIKTACGADFLVGCRLSGDEFYEKLYPDVHGYTVEDLPDIVTALIDAGVTSVDLSAGALDVPGYFAGPNPRLFPNEGYGGYLPLAAAAKRVSSVPIVVTGRMNDPELIERAISEGMCDMVGMARQFLADPDFPKKIAEGRPEDIRRCIACGYCAVGNGGLTSVDDHQVECAVNPATGWNLEGYFDIRPVARPKRVIVAGGGAAGMEAARVATLRGHNVTLYEKSDRLGGQLWPAGRAPGKSDIHFLIDWFETQLKKLNVDVRLGTEATPETIAAEKADALIVATGAGQFIPPIPGIDRTNVVLGLDVLEGRATTGRRVVVIGGEDGACEVADFITDRQPEAEVTLTTLLPGFATRGHLAAIIALAALRQKKVGFVDRVQEYKEITDQGIQIVDGDGVSRFLPADTVVVAAGARPDNGLLGDVKGKGMVRYSVFAVGDASSPREINDAVRSGAIVAQHI
ncbi:MAG: FAD-dependent oxidoreductase [Dehalococcoidia bacterium]|nr:FAD-dependent oxidoreductase [Dehalococcoidia bacterium]